MRKYRFIKLPTTDGDDGKVTVGVEVLTKKDLGKVIETTHDLGGNVHFERVFDGLGIDTFPPPGKESKQPTPDFLDHDKGFLPPPGVEVKNPVEETPKKSSRKKPVKKESSKKVPKKATKKKSIAPETSLRAYTVTCYQCNKEFKKKAKDIFSLNPWELVCPSCKKKKK